MKKSIIYIPLSIILLIQVFDKNDVFFYVQIILLILMIAYVILMNNKIEK